MLVYIFAISLIIILWFLLVNRYKNGRKWYCIINTSYLLLIVGLRNPSIGMYDTIGAYIPTFRMLQKMSMSDIYNYGFNDLGFEIYSKLFSYVSINEQLWIFVTAIPLIITISVLIYRKSKYPIISYLLFLSLGYYCFLFTMMRQMLALGLIIWAYLKYDEKKYKSTFILMILASAIHVTSLVFVLYYFIDKFKIYRYWKLLAIIGTPFCIIFSSDLLDKIFKLFNFNRFTRYLLNIDKMNFTTFYIHLLILLLSYIATCKIMSITKLEKTNEIYFMCSTIAVLFLALSKQFALIYRIAMYFGIFNIILLPNALECVKKKYGLILKILVIIMFTIYFFGFTLDNWFMVPYKFYWE